MVTRDQLYRLIDDLPDDELDVAARILEHLRAASQPMYTPETAPDNDEPVTPEQAAAVAEALADLEAGRTMTTAELLEALEPEGR